MPIPVPVSLDLDGFRVSIRIRHVGRQIKLLPDLETLRRDLELFDNQFCGDGWLVHYVIPP